MLLKMCFIASPSNWRELSIPEIECTRLLLVNLYLSNIHDNTLMNRETYWSIGDMLCLEETLMLRRDKLLQ